MFKKRLKEWLDKAFSWLEEFAKKVDVLTDRIFPEKYRDQKLFILLAIFFFGFFVTLATVLFRLEVLVLLFTSIIVFSLSTVIGLLFLSEKNAEGFVCLFIFSLIYLLVIATSVIIFVS